MPIHAVSGALPRRAVYTGTSLEVSVKHWIVMFRPETFAAAREYGLMAVLHNHRRRFSEFAPGDRFVAYISRQRVLDAHGEVVSKPFREAADAPKSWVSYTESATPHSVLRLAPMSPRLVTVWRIPLTT
jgi:hypothetical protein